MKNKTAYEYLRDYEERGETIVLADGKVVEEKEDDHAKAATQ